MKTKKQYKYFSIFNHEKEQDYLREMHKQGWKFIKVTGLGVYHFEECEPQDVVYNLEFAELIAECDEDERRLIFELSKAACEVLRKNKIKNNKER